MVERVLRMHKAGCEPQRLKENKKEKRKERIKGEACALSFPVFFLIKLFNSSQKNLCWQ